MRNRTRRTMYLDKLVYLALTTIMLVGCGGGGSDPAVTGVSTQTINGGGVKGPLTSANVAVYSLNFAANVTVDTTAIDTGTTDAQAKIQNLVLPFPLAPPYILEFTATPGVTKDLATCTDPTDSATCFAPILTTMRTVITSEMLTSGQNIYATPLTTMAVNIALQNATDTDVSGTIESDEFLAAVTTAGKQVASTLGFGMGSSIDIFNTPPLIDDTTDTTEEQADTASYRAAVEAVGAVVAQMDLQATGDSDTVINELADDLADGVIDGQLESSGAASTIFTDTTLDVLQQDPSNLTIPNTTILVGDIEAELAAEATDTGATVDTTALTDGTTIVVETAPAETDPDLDNDTVLNVDDAFPDDISASKDTDGDGSPDEWNAFAPNSGAASVKGLVLDDDDDNDGVADGSDAFPLDSTETTDTDTDGTGNNEDADDDGDGVLDTADAFPLNPNASVANDADGDGWSVSTDAAATQDPDDADNANPGIVFDDYDDDGLADSGGLNPDGDDDNDGILDGSDAFPLDATEWVDTDTDGTGNNADTDDDNDTVLDVDDAFPLDSAEDTDTDGDGTGNNADTDDDGDTLSDVAEGSGAVDTDGDGTPDSLDIDSDNDGYLDSVDLDPLDANVTVNTAPLATDQSETVAEDGSLPITLSVTDPDAADTAGAMTYTVGAASNGTATDNADGTVTYTPSANWSGSDSFTYSVTDTSGAVSNTATVSITVTAVNDAPVGVADTASTSEDTPVTTGNVLTNDTDTEGDTLSVSAADAASANGGTVTNNGDGTFTYTPAANWSGTDTFGYTVSDGTDTATATVTITVSAVNDAPVGVADTASTSEDTPVTTGNVLTNDTDTEGDTLSVSAADAASANGGTVTNNGDGTFTYTPAANWSGTDTFGYTVSDGTDTATATVTITVSAVNDAPVGVADTASTSEDTPVTTGNVLTNDTDTEGDTLSVSAADAASANGGTVTNNGDGTFTYTPAANWSGTDTFGYTVSDGTDTATATVTITVSAVNDAPVGVADTASTSEDTPVTTGNVLTNDTDTEGDTLSVSAADAASANGGTVTNNGDGTFTYTPAANWSGTDTFGYTVSDGTDTATATVTITVSAVNDAPNAVADAAGVLVDSSSNSIDVLANDSDVEGSGLTITAVDNPSTQSGTVTTDGSTVTYTPAASFSGDDTFTYTVSDGTDSSVATVTVTVSNNQSPVITEGATTSVNMDEDNSPTAFSLTLNATDAESDTITWSISSAATSGTATASGTGTSMVIGYAPNANWNGTDSFIVQVSDGTSTGTITVAVNVAAQNDAPVITEGATATVNMDEDGSPTAFSQTLNATDLDGDTITWTISSVATNGVASASGTGTSKVIGYSPDANFNGSDSFDVQITDGTVTDTITVTVNVAAQNDAPTISGTAPVGTIGVAYSFTPTSDDVDTGDTLTFSCTNCPTGWTSSNFNTATGEISGAPTSAGTVSNVTITVGDGTTTIDLGPFDITINATGAVWDNFNWDDGSNWQ